MENLDDLRLLAFLAAHPDVDIVEWKYGGEYDYKALFRGDVPRNSIDKFARAIGADAEWTMFGCPTLFFSERMLQTMASCVAEHVEFRRCMARAKALQADAAWEQRAIYRVLFRPLCRPCPIELSDRIEDPDAELITRRKDTDNAWDWRPIEDEEVIAVLTSNDETMALLKLAYPGTYAEERCHYFQWNGNKVR